MSTEDLPAPVAPVADEPLPTPEPGAQPRKSYRRKYRKIMVVFEEKMRDSTTLFKEQQRINDISQRLSEQNDQLLHLLLELNSCAQVPGSLRYDIRPPRRIVPQSERQAAHYDEESGHAALRKGRQQLRTGEISSRQYQQLEDTVLESSDFTPHKSYASLVKTAMVTPEVSGYLTDFTPSIASGFLTMKQEEQYMEALDVFLAGKAGTSRPYATNTLGSRTAERTADLERELQLKNPVSVYNWLRKHQPQVFLQDHEPGAEKAAKTPGSRASKRTGGGKESTKQEPELYDDEGIAIDVGANSKGKRKNREEDGGYRPKGGYGRPTKRRKEDGVGSAKRSKRMSMENNYA